MAKGREPRNETAEDALSQQWVPKFYLPATEEPLRSHVPEAIGHRSAMAEALDQAVVGHVLFDRAMRVHFGNVAAHRIAASGATISLLRDRLRFLNEEMERKVRGHVDAGLKAVALRPGGHPNSPTCGHPKIPHLTCS